MQKILKNIALLWNKLPFASVRGTFALMGRKVLFLRIRLLPIVIFCSGLLLSVKISVLWQNLHPGEEVWGMSETYAENPLNKPDTRQKKASTELNHDIKPSSVTRPSSKETSPASTPDIPTHNVKVENIDATTLTREQFQVLLELSQRQKNIAQRENKIPREEATLSVIDEQIRSHTEELKKTKKRLENLLNQVEEKENINTARLVKMAEGMKPKDAAKILETLDFSVLLELMEKIKPKSGSAILSSMEPAKAGYLMTELSKRRKLIKHGDQSGFGKKEG